MTRNGFGLYIAAPIVILTLFSLFGARPAVAGTMHEDFRALLSRTAGSEMVSGLVMLAEQPELDRIERRIQETGQTSRWRRHQFVVVEAQQTAARTQGGILSLLQELQAQGAVRSFQSFWITNVIAVEASPQVFEQLADRADVGTIFVNQPIELRPGWADTPVEPAKGLRSLPDNLVCVNVAPVWAESLRGQGRLVCSFDTGADGDHEAFAARWRGLRSGVDWSWAWRDPGGSSQFPFDTGYHGTHVLGIMVGEKPDSTPIGVAPAAEWIAARILNPYVVSDIIACYEWAVDPDGDPGTVSDVPDVINNSWGTSGNCDQTYWNAIDVVEAAGIVNTIAVDNSGPSPASVNSPESRAASPFANFGVGNVNPHVEGYPISNTSGRGPSPCDMTSIKPEVTAPGTQIYSSMPNDGYGTLSGTSMACPHVSGAVAILRQVDPDLTVNQVKHALMATAYDRGAAGEDNDYGSGIIDLAAAVNLVRPLPNYPPQNLRAEVAEDDVTLRWDAPQQVSPLNPLDAYRIYRAPVGEGFPLEPLGELRAGLGGAEYTDADLPPGLWHYVVTALYIQGESGPSNEVEVETVAPSAVEAIRPADALSLLAGPNPFTQSTIIRYQVRGAGPVRLSVHDAEGREVRRLVDGPLLPAGASAAAWDGADASGRALPSGTYFVRLAEGGQVRSRAVTLLK